MIITAEKMTRRLDLLNFTIAYLLRLQEGEKKLMARRGRPKEPKVTLWYSDFGEIGKNLSGEEFKELWYAAAEYQVHGTEYTGDNRTVAILFPVIKLQSDRYASFCRQNAANGFGHAAEENACTPNSTEISENTPPNPNPIPYPNPVSSSNEEEYGATSAPVHTRKKFIKPTAEQVEDYCAQQGLQVDAQRFVDYYESVGWVIGKGKPMKSWQAALRTWARSQSPPVEKEVYTPQEPADIDPNMISYAKELLYD